LLVWSDATALLFSSHVAESWTCDPDATESAQMLRQLSIETKMMLPFLGGFDSPKQSLHVITLFSPIRCWEQQTDGSVVIQHSAELVIAKL